MKRVLFLIGLSFSIGNTAIGQPNILPAANAGEDQVLMDSNEDGEEVFSLDGTASMDSDGTIASYEWSEPDGNVLGTASTLDRTVSVGSEEIKLTVTDDEGGVGVDYVQLFVGHATNYGNNRISIRGGDNQIFVNGINLAWNNFSLDVVEFDEEYFTSVFEKLSAYGANGLRWWLHTNGRHSPQFDDAGMVKKIAPNDIRNMRRALDMAHSYGVVVNMCLFSFDLLQSQGQDKDQMRKLLEDEAVRQSYIDNALTPILKEIGDHPAVMTWEIFNEPEGMTNEFGWSAEKTTMAYVQQFVNKTAAAIHDHTIEALVSNGSWSVKATTDVENYFNYYRDDRLIAAGGEANGILDFYQFHYYPQHFGNAYSPFHRPASFWDVDKPIVIGEFPVAGVEDKASPHLTTTECYQRAMEYGYAGVMAWDYSGFGGGDIETAKEGLEYLSINYSSDVLIGDDPDFNEAPVVEGKIPALRAFSGDNMEFANHFDLSTIFTDPEGKILTYDIYDITNLDFTEIEFDGSMMSVYPYDNVKGTETVVVKGTDPKGASEWVTFNISLGEDTGNLAKFKNIMASSSESGNEDRSPELANDGDLTTRWSSVYEDQHWIEVDLGTSMDFNEIKMLWEDAYAKSYQIEVSEDQNSWTEIYAESNGDGNWDDIQIERATGRYLRLNFDERATEWGFSLWELEVYNNITTAVKELSQIRVYPNPAIDQIQIDSYDQILSIKLTDLNGRQFSGLNLNAQGQLDTYLIKTGIYLLTVNTKNDTRTFRIVKQN